MPGINKLYLLLSGIYIAVDEVADDRPRRQQDTCIFSDVVLIVNDKSIPASRAILAAASPVFRDMFAKRSAEEVKVVPLPGEALSAVEFMVRYVSSPKAMPIPGEWIMPLGIPTLMHWGITEKCVFQILWKKFWYPFEGVIKW